MRFSNEVLVVIGCLVPLSCGDSSGSNDNTTTAPATSVVTPTDSVGGGGPTGGSPTNTAGVGPTGATTPPSSNTAASGPATGGAPVTTDTDPNTSGPGAGPTGTTTGEVPVNPVPTMSSEPAPSSTSTDTSGTTSPSDDSDVVDVGADEKFSFFVTSYHHIKLLSGRDEGFGGDLRWNGATTGLEGADALCQEMARRVSFGHRTWRAYLSTSTVNAIDRVGDGPWYDFSGALVAQDVAGLLVPKAEGGGGFGGGGGGIAGGCVEGDTDRPSGAALDCGVYDETGLFHNGKTDQDGDGVDDDDHDTMTATLADGTYAGFSCDDWTSTTATPPDEGGGGGGGGGFGGLSSGIMMGHTWPAGSGQHWAESHAGHACAAGTNFIQDGAGDSATVGGGGGYGGFYCLAVD